jgi:hypothetical protein
MDKKEINIRVDYYFGDPAFVITDPDQMEGIITGIKILPGKQILYGLSIRNIENWFYSFELSSARDEAKRLLHNTD